MVTYADTAPQPGAGGLSDAQWQTLATSWGDGIVNDNRGPGVGGDGNSSYALSPSASDRTVNVFRLCPYRVRGYTFIPSQTNLTLPTLPAPTGTSQQAHMIVARLTFATRTISLELVSGPVVGGVPSRPGLTRNSEVWEDPIWVLRGGNGAASSLEVIDYRRWVGAQYMLWDGAALNTLTASAPIGSTAQIINGDQFYLASRVGVLDWVNYSNPAWTEITLAGGLAAGAAEPQTRIAQGHREFRGQVQKSSGSWGPGIYTIGSVSDDPGEQRGNVTMPIAVATGTSTVNGWVTADGTVRFQVPAGATVTSFYLDPMTYALEP